MIPPAAQEPSDILIVEDSRTQAEQLKFMLERHEYATRVARTGVEALARMREQKPILVLSDINMPEMDGYELCRAIRADPTLADLPVILLTSLSDPQDVVLGLESGADNFVIKPPDEGYLLSRIRYIMANRHLRSMETARISLEIQVAGRKHMINADRLQILHLLLSTYESAVLRSKQLAAAQEQLRQLNENLEEKVRERTAALTLEITERKRLHEQLEQSEEKYRLLFATNPMPMWVFDIETLRFLAVNDSAIRHYGYTRDEFLGMTIVNIRPDEDEPRLRDHLNRDDRGLVTDVWNHRKKSGEVIDVEITAHDLDFDGRRARLVLAQDVTERKRAEQALRESEERVRLITDTITEVFWMADVSIKKIFYVSSAYERVWGRSYASLLADPRSFLDAIHPDDLPRVLENLAIQQAGQPFAHEYRIKRPDGSVRWIWGRGFPVPNANGPVTRYVGVAQDITDRKLAEESRRRLEERFAAIFNASPVAIAFGTLDGRLIDVNPELCALSGYTREEMIGRTKSELMLWADSLARENAMTRLRNEKVVRGHETKFRRKSGEVRTVLVSMETLALARDPMLLTMIVDVTDQKALEAQLFRAQRVESVGRLSTGIAHDMNNILAPIMMSAPLLRMGLGPDETEKILSTVETSAQRGAALVRQLLIFGRGVEGERRPVDPASVIEEVARIAGQTFPKSISLTAHVADDVWPVNGDATQLHQVLLNLCVNARDAMPEGGDLVMGAENVQMDATSSSALHRDAKPGRYVVIRVADTGVGIPPEIADQIFDPFFTTKELGQGTGLGLSTVLGIVKSHGGFVRLDSEPGRGTTFEVYLPASVAEQSVPPAASTGLKAPIGNGELILIVDDEEAIRGILRDTFVRYNYKVVSASNGVEASAIFAANSEVQLVMTDIDMPLMDGISLIRVLRRQNPAIKVIISTGLGSRGVTDMRRIELEALAVSAILVKPFTPEKLLRAAHAALSGDGPGPSGAT